MLVSSGPELLLAALAAADPGARRHGGRHRHGSGSADSLHHQRDLIERNVIQRALVNNGYSRARAADALGISRVTLYKKMKKYGLMKESAKM